MADRACSTVRTCPAEPAERYGFQLRRALRSWHMTGAEASTIARPGKRPRDDQRERGLRACRVVLESVASRRGRRELTALIQRAPKVAQLRAGDRLDEVPVEQVQVGDVIVVRTGEVVPVDGTVMNPEAMIDTSTLSGELLPQTASRGMAVLSGSANAGGPFDVRADRPAGESGTRRS
jgi:hypothetical protein